VLMFPQVPSCPLYFSEDCRRCNESVTTMSRSN